MQLIEERRLEEVENESDEDEIMYTKSAHRQWRVNCDIEYDWLYPLSVQKQVSTKIWWAIVLLRKFNQSRIYKY